MRSWRSARSRPPRAPPTSCLPPQGRRSRAERGSLFPARNRYVVALRGAGIELARTADLLVRILDHFLPLRNPADRTRNPKQHREHRGREPHRLERDAGIEVDVGIELLLDEIIVMQRDPLELHGDIE